MVGGRQGHAPCKIFSLQQILFMFQYNFLKVVRPSQHCVESGRPQPLDMLPDLKQWSLSISQCLSVVLGVVSAIDVLNC